MLDEASKLVHSDNCLRDIYRAVLVLLDISNTINIYIRGEHDHVDPCTSRVFDYYNLRPHCEDGWTYWMGILQHSLGPIVNHHLPRNSGSCTANLSTDRPSSWAVAK